MPNNLNDSITTVQKRFLAENYKYLLNATIINSYAMLSWEMAAWRADLMYNLAICYIISTNASL